MINEIRTKNEHFRQLKIKLRNNNPRQSWSELESILSDIQDRRAFIFLMDAYETEKEITRDIIEQMLDNTIGINADIITMLEQHSNSNISETIKNIFNTQNLKSLLIAAIVIGVLISVVSNKDIAGKIVDVVITKEVQKHD